VAFSSFFQERAPREYDRVDTITEKLLSKTKMLQLDKATKEGVFN
jgi:hypothetical protein